MSKLLFLVVLFLLHSTGSLFTQEIQDNIKEIEIISVPWYILFSTRQTTEDILDNSERTIVSIRNPRLTNTIDAYLLNELMPIQNSDFAGDFYIDVRIVCLLKRVSGKTDTLSFGRYPHKLNKAYLIFNGKDYTADTGLIESITYFLPYSHKRLIDTYNTFQYYIGK